MKFGPVPPTKIPKQDPSKVLLLAERWQRSAEAQQRWAERAKQAVDFFEGRQWTEDQLTLMKRQKRPALKFNIIAPLVRLVLGYNASNKSDITFLPGQDNRATEQVAESLTRIEKVIAEGSRLDFVDTEVFLDGLIASRGYYDTRLDWETNDLGEIKTSAADPFSVYLDPDADSYDLNENHSYVQQSKYVSLDEIEAAFGKKVMELLQPFCLGQTPLAPISSLIIDDEISPVRTFGERHEDDVNFWDSFYSLVGDFVDTRRRSIRMIETQYKVVEPKNVVIDLETGDKKVLPDEWGKDKIQKILLYGETVGNPLRVQRRMVERIQWTTMAGDLLLYDAPSFYDSYTLTGYFPYFRRGMTKGMVDDLIDPQMEKNKRRSAQIEIVSKTANGGWKYADDSLDPVQERNLQKFGSSPGVNIKYKAGKPAPEQIEPNSPPMAQERLELRADDDIKQISGINESSLGQDERVQSGRAVQAKQRQAVLSIQMYMDNLKRSKELLGTKHLEIIQNHYTEPRLYRIMGKDGKFSQIMLNQQAQNKITGVIQIMNDVTVGKYAVKVDDAPLSDTFLDAQFQEMLMLLQKMGPAVAPYMPMFADLMIDMSSMPRKDEWIERIKAVAEKSQQDQQQGKPPPGHHPPAPHGGGHPAHPPAGHAEPGPLGGGAVAQNVVPFSHAQQRNG
jgi:hypothetical protein